MINHLQKERERRARAQQRRNSKATQDGRISKFYERENLNLKTIVEEQRKIIKVKNANLNKLRLERTELRHQIDDLKAIIDNYEDEAGWRITQ